MDTNNDLRSSNDYNVTGILKASTWKINTN